MTPLHGRSPAHWPPPPDLWYSSRVNKILVTPPPLLTGRSYGSLPAHTRLPSCALAIPCHHTEILEFPGWRVEGRCKILYPVLWKAFILQPYEWICPKMGLAGVGSSALYAASPFLSWYCVVVMLWAGESPGLSLCLRGYVVVVVR